MFNCATCIIATYATALQKCTIHDTPDSNKYSMLNGNINNRYQRIELCLYICAKDEILHFVYIVQHIDWYLCYKFINYIVKFFTQNENITHNNLLSCNYYAARTGFNIPCALSLKRYRFHACERLRVDRNYM